MVHLYNTKHSSKYFVRTISFYLHQSPMKAVLWSPFNTEGSAEALSLGTKSHRRLAVFWQKAMLLVLVDGGYWEGSWKGKSKRWRVRWRENPTGWGCGFVQRTKSWWKQGKVWLSEPRIKARLSFALWFSLYWHSSSLLSRFIVLHYEPFMCSRGRAHRYSSCGPLVILSAPTLLIRKEGRLGGSREPAAIVSSGSLMGWNNSQDAQAEICMYSHVRASSKMKAQYTLPAI